MIRPRKRPLGFLTYCSDEHPARTSAPCFTGSACLLLMSSDEPRPCSNKHIWCSLYCLLLAGSSLESLHLHAMSRSRMPQPSKLYCTLIVAYNKTHIFLSYRVTLKYFGSYTNIGLYEILNIFIKIFYDLTRVEDTTCYYRLLSGGSI